MTPEELPADEPLVALVRGGLVESVHRGRYAVCDASGGVTHSVGDADALCFPRSALKPFQAMPLVLSGAADALGLTDPELAIACASHYGEEQHVRAVAALLEKAGLTENDLDNGAHPPAYAPAAEELVRRGEKPRKIHGNCSGKHAGMLAVCRHLGWDAKGYRDQHHPLQGWIKAIISEVCDTPEREMPTAGDGCGAPAFALPLRSLATGFARLATGDGLPEDVGLAAKRIRDAMRAEPHLVAGTGNTDTRVMETSNLVAKRGADGVWTAGSESGWGLALKVTDGAERAVAPLVKDVLARLDESPGIEVPPVRDLHGHAVGEMVVLKTKRGT
ncbi:MAG: asparaginase [Rubrobacter sp.]